MLQQFIAGICKKNRKTKGRPDYLSFLDANCDNTYQSDCQLDEKGWRKDLTMLSSSEKGSFSQDLRI